MSKNKYLALVVLWLLPFSSCKTENWQQITDKEHLVHFSMPGKIETIEKDNAFSNGFRMKIRTYLSEISSSKLNFIVLIQKIEETKNTKGALDGISKEIIESEFIKPMCDLASLSDQQSIQIEKKTIQIGPYKGYSTVFLNGESPAVWFSEQCLFVDNKLVLLKVFGENNKATFESAERFFASFGVVPPSVASSPSTKESSDEKLKTSKR